VPDDREAGERLQPQPPEDEHGQPQPECRRGDAPGDGQATTATTRRVGENLVAKN
jgi:hypothetical protein